MQVVGRVSWDDLEWGSKLARDWVGGRMPAPLRAPRLHDLNPESRAAGISEKLRAELVQEMPSELREPWNALRDPEARVVVTGQQPGCAGGALLVLYKIATAVALARRLASRGGRPVVPLFWNATDDEDFEEIARVAWPDRARGLLFLELPAEERRAAGWVGDLSATGDVRACQAVLELLADAESRRALQERVPEAARDHGEWVGRLVQRIFPELAVLDARSPALRRHGAPLFARWLEQQGRAQQLLEASARELEAHGYAVALRPQSARPGLFLTAERRRRKVGDDLEPLRQALLAAPETLSPNVVLRPLLQDLLLPTIAHVVGPSEIDYLLELRPLRALLEITEPALVPRASHTVVDADMWAAAQRLGIGARELVRDPDVVPRTAVHERTAPARARVAAAFESLRLELAALNGDTGKLVTRATRRLDAVREDVVAQLEESARLELLRAQPELAMLPAFVRPRDQPQERRVAALWLAPRWRDAMRGNLLQLADQHLDTVLEQRAEHALVTT